MKLFSAVFPCTGSKGPKEYPGSIPVMRPNNLGPYLDVFFNDKKTRFAIRLLPMDYTVWMDTRVLPLLISALVALEESDG